MTSFTLFSLFIRQEVDHYYDFFQPEFNKLGYTGYFAPKPTSACLDVAGGSSDGCALFIKRSKLKVISCETKTLALSIAGLTDEGELEEDDRNIKTQNQVGIIAVCEFLIPPAQERGVDVVLPEVDQRNKFNPFKRPVPPDLSPPDLRYILYYSATCI